MRLLLLFIVLFASVWLGVMLVDDPGHVIIHFHHSRITMTLATAVFILLAGFVITYCVLRAASYLGSLTGRFRNWLGRRRSHQAHSLTTMGLIESAEGKWKSAEKHLLKAVGNSENPLINYLAAARAAQEQGDQARRDRYLQKAQTLVPSAKVAVALSQAHLQMDSGQLEQALATLRHLQMLEPDHPHVLKLLSKVYVSLRDWKNIIALLPDLRSYKVAPAAELNELEIQAHSQQLTALAERSNSDAMIEAWNHYPYRLRVEPRVVACYCQGLLKFKQDDEAEKVLYASLKKALDPQLITLYGLTRSSQTAKQLSNAEYWLKSHPSDANLLLALGRLAMHNQLWGKARTYLENSLANQPLLATYDELAKLLEQLGETRLAADYYKHGLEKSLKQQQQQQQQ